MDIDPTSTQFRQPTNAFKPNWSQRQPLRRQAVSDRNTGPKFQKINNISQETHLQGIQKGNQYSDSAEIESQDIDDEVVESTDYVNFLGATPCYHS